MPVFVVQNIKEQRRIRFSTLLAASVPVSILWAFEKRPRGGGERGERGDKTSEQKGRKTEES